MALTNETYVFIHLDGEWLPCGFLTIREDGRRIVSTFQYGLKYLARDNAIPVDPVVLPLSRGTFTSSRNAPIFGAIRDVSPDGWGRHLLDRAAEPNSPSEFEYLTVLPVEDRVGALGFGENVASGPAPIVPPWKTRPVYGAELSLKDMMAAADRVESLEQLSPKHRRFLLRGSSIGGAQPKAPANYEGKQWIAKFSRQYDAWNTCRIENANMQLAGECGIIVPETRILTIAGRDVFLIQRFDREVKGKKKHFISAATMLATNDILSGSYEEIAVQIKKYGAPGQVKKDLEQLYRRMIFNILCNNSDDHLRNHGFLYEPGYGWVLSPAYDIVPQPDMGPGEERRLTLGVGVDGSRTPSLGNAVSVCAVFGLSADDGRNIADSMKKIFLSRWESIYHECSVPEKDFSILAGAFTNHLLSFRQGNRI